MCSGQATLVSLGVLVQCVYTGTELGSGTVCGTGIWDTDWILCCAGREQWRAFTNGSSVEMSNPDMVAGSDLSLLHQGGWLVRDRQEGRRGSCHSMADLPLCPSAPASHDADGDTQGADDDPLSWAEQIPLQGICPRLRLEELLYHCVCPKLGFINSPMMGDRHRPWEQPKA